MGITHNNIGEGARLSAIQEQEWGTFHTRPVHQVTMTNAAGATARIINYGATLLSLEIPDRHGQLIDVTLGFDTFDEYLGTHPFFGATIGRCANRIAGGMFTLDSHMFSLDVNNDPNHIHGGRRGFDKHLWDITRAGQGLGDVFVKMAYTSIDGDEGYPGNVEAAITYTLTFDNTLRIEMQAGADASTPVNMTNHSYWNLNGHESGSILDHEVTLIGDAYTPIDETRITTGEIKPVDGTPYDFTTPKPIRTNMDALPLLGEDDPGGYDHNYVIRDADGTVKPAAQIYSPQSGLTMYVRTNQPGIQFYTGNFLDGSIIGKAGVPYGKHHALCLETQKFPDAINKQGVEGWPSVILRPGEPYYHEVQYAFSCDKK
jgi:aldose 1-epimerase